MAFDVYYLDTSKETVMAFEFNSMTVARLSNRDGEVVEASLYFETKELAQAAALRFPRYARVRITTLHGCPDGKLRHVVDFRVALCSGLTTGEKNETGEKRLAAFRKVVRAHFNHFPKVEQQYGNSLPIGDLI
jgi:hypothetical protein